MPNDKIWTADDPVQTALNSMHWAQINKKADIDLATVILAFSRADTEIIEVSESRDQKTMQR